MHTLQPKHTKLSEKEAEKVLEELKISRVQLPKILLKDPALPEECEKGDVIKIERKKDGNKKETYYRVVVGGEE